MVRWPALRATHPGFFKVAIGILLLHVVFSVDSLLAPNVALRGPAFRYQAEISPLWTFAVAHLVVAVLEVYGFYWRFRLARIAFLLSVTVFTLQGSVWLLAAAERKASFTGGALLIFVAIAAAASYREPEFNPAVSMKPLLAPIGALVAEQLRDSPEQ